MEIQSQHYSLIMQCGVNNCRVWWCLDHWKGCVFVRVKSKQLSESNNINYTQNFAQVTNKFDVFTLHACDRVLLY